MFWFPLLCRLLRHKITKYNPDSIIIDSFAAVKNIVQPSNSIKASAEQDTQLED